MTRTDKPVVSPAVDEPDDAPEWTDEMFERAQFSIGDKVIRPAKGTITRAFTTEETALRKGRRP